MGNINFVGNGNFKLYDECVAYNFKSSELHGEELHWFLENNNRHLYTSQKKKRNTRIFAVFFSMVSSLNHSVNR